MTAMYGVMFAVPAIWACGASRWCLIQAPMRPM